MRTTTYRLDLNGRQLGYTSTSYTLPSIQNIQTQIPMVSVRKMKLVRSPATSIQYEHHHCQPEWKWLIQYTWSNVYYNMNGIVLPEPKPISCLLSCFLCTVASAPVRIDKEGTCHNYWFRDLMWLDWCITGVNAPDVEVGALHTFFILRQSSDTTQWMGMRLKLWYVSYVVVENTYINLN